MDTRTQYGIVAKVSLKEYEEGRMKKHELTRKDKEIDRIRHVSLVNAQTGLVFLAYKSQISIDFVVEKTVMSTPEYDFTADDGISHAVWVISGRNGPFQPLRNSVATMIATASVLIYSAR